MLKKISIIHPSRGRSAMALSTAKKWLDKADNIENIEYLMMVARQVSHEDFQSYLNNADPRIRIIGSDKDFMPLSVNEGAELTSGELIIVVSDDFDCPEHWDTLLLSALHDKKDFIVKTNTLDQHWIITLPIMDRAYYNRFGYIYFPEYNHMFCDTEMTHVGQLLGRVIDLDIVFPHEHYASGKMEKDATNIRNDSTWNQGESLYFERAAKNFGLQKVVEFPDIHISHRMWLKNKGVSI